ncbi:uncharacterized protein LOC123514022 [Portunus trituberculatus]|uniref:uncharacterized protein LOC123514022 n=1 Tax=Portunus trituberculatus TaxID=210409 RepID=UPI001E1CE28C|nr:uncharacterized protein LOC123514022 [Portunus trituberculatus]
MRHLELPYESSVRTVLEWHRYFIPTLFALKYPAIEPVSPPSNFSMEGLFGDLSALRDLWEDRNLKDDDRSAFRYVVELQKKLAETAQIAANNADIGASKYKTYFDIKSQDCQLQPGDEVLLPSDSSKLLGKDLVQF